MDKLNIFTLIIATVFAALIELLMFSGDIYSKVGFIGGTFIVFLILIKSDLI